MQIRRNFIGRRKPNWACLGRIGGLMPGCAFFLMLFLPGKGLPQSGEPKNPAPTHIGPSETVVVTATRSAKELQESPGSTTVISREDIQRQDFRTVDQAVSVIPGVFDRRGKGIMDTQSSVVLRGFPTQQRTLVMLDGIALNDSYTGAVQFGGLGTANVRQIEVVKGPFSSLYGGSAMGGVINIITRMPQKRELVLSSGYGSGLGNQEAPRNLNRFCFSYGDIFRGRLSVIVGYGRNATDGYASDLNVQSIQPPAIISGYSITTDSQGNKRFVIGDRGRNNWVDDSISLKAVYELSSDSHLGFTFMKSRYRYQYDDPGTNLKDAAGNSVFAYTSGSSAVREATYLAGAGHKEQNLYNLSYETQTGDIKISSKVGLVKVYNNWYTTPGTAAATTRSGGAGSMARTPVEKLLADFQASIPLNARNILTAGGDFSTNQAETEESGLSNWRDEKSITAKTYSAGGKSASAAFFLQDEMLLRNNLTAYWGVRGDYWRTFDGYANQVGASGYPIDYGGRGAFSLSPKVAVVYRASESTAIRSSLGKAFRAPTVYEMYRTWTASSGTIYKGNPDLDPETAVSWDLGINRKLWRGATAQVAYFENYMSHMVYRYTDPTNSKIQRYVNAGKAKGRGVEMEFGQQLTSMVHLFANGTFNNAKITENPAKPSTQGMRLAFLPRWVSNTGIEFEKSRFTAALIGRYSSKVYSNDENKDIVSNVSGSYDPFFIVNARVAYKLSQFLTLSLSAENLLDRKYFFSYLAPRRSGFIELIVNY